MTDIDWKKQTDKVIEEQISRFVNSEGLINRWNKISFFSILFYQIWTNLFMSNRVEPSFTKRSPDCIRASGVISEADLRFISTWSKQIIDTFLYIYIWCNVYRLLPTTDTKYCRYQTYIFIAYERKTNYRILWCNTLWWEYQWLWGNQSKQYWTLKTCRALLESIKWNRGTFGFLTSTHVQPYTIFSNSKYNPSDFCNSAKPPKNKQTKKHNSAAESNGSIPPNQP